MEGHIPECRDKYLEQFRRKMESVDHDHGEHVLHVVHESGEHPDKTGENEQEGGVNLDLADKRPGCLDFPDDVEVRFQAAEGEDKGDKETQGADKSELADGDVLGVPDNGLHLVGGPVQTQHVEDDGQVIAHEVAETDRERDGSEQDEQGDDGHERGVGEAGGSGHPVIVQEGLAGYDSDLYGSGRSFGDIVKQPFP